MSYFLHAIEYDSDTDGLDYSYDSEGDSCYSDTETS